ncbi:hypothetical protein JCM8208_003419 [Rhodotorula glutinis]
MTATRSRSPVWVTVVAIFIFVFTGTRARFFVFESLGMVERPFRPPGRASFVVVGKGRVDDGLFWIAAIQFAFHTTTADFQVAAREAPLDNMKSGLESWTFLGFKRTESGRTESGAFHDEDIVQVLEATDDVAWAFKAHAIPEVMRAIDLLETGPARGAAARSTSSRVDNLELYPGLVAEEPKPSLASLAPRYSISRAIMSDASALVRGDRFCTFRSLGSHFACPSVGRAVVGGARRDLQALFRLFE